ncbi:MarR family transcriptional regulator [Nonomuraea phyllanthi]|uniref:MarR family transcriptional regulator n=1 Tax=Nonomuraea phyllanthi TaxID=2219224 RepID=A0A5C4WZ13_9ACTN|nr:MarR family transcriptional regulator [Nonomuraea phyllanthi]
MAPSSIRTSIRPSTAGSGSVSMTTPFLIKRGDVMAKSLIRSFSESNLSLSILDVVKPDEIDAMVPRWEQAGMSPSLIATLELGKRMSRLHLLFEHAVKAELAELGLTYAEFDVLAALSRAAEPYGMKPSELSKALFLTSGGISNVLQRLAAAGYVEREANAGDARSRWVQLTDEGRRVTDAALEAAGRAYGDVAAGVPDEAVRAAADALREVLTHIGRRRYR